MQLFRKEALENQQQRCYGDVVLFPRISHSLLTNLLAIWVSLAAIWLGSSNYARKETVNGWLEPTDGIVRIYPENNGIVNKVLVSEGDFVEAGQLLLEIRSDTVLSTGDTLEHQLLQDISEHNIVLKNQINSLKRLYSDRDAALVKAVDFANKELGLLDTQIGAATELHTLLRKRTNRYATLNNTGSISQLEFDRVLEQELSARLQIQQLSRERESQIAKIENLHAQKRYLPSEQTQEVSVLQEKLSTLEQQKARVESYVKNIRAPRAGIVNNLQAIPGQQFLVGRGIPLLTLLPSQSDLQANILVPVRSAGFVRSGQPLNIRYDAFPHQKFGLYSATVDRVPNTILLPSEVLNLPFNIQEPVFLVTAKLSQNEVNAYGNKISLRSGMTLNADIRLSERSVFQWLLDPIFSLNGRL